jgi:hypothetical protein
MTKEITPDNLYTRIAGLLHAARQTVVRAVNKTMVYTYYEIGRMIVEDEQQGKERAEYGKQVLKELSTRLTADFGKGFSERNLEQMRQFYLTYSISQKSSAKFQHPHFQLSWSHYLKLMRIENPDERKFYEIECYQNNWSLKELQRQFDTALYERLALSRDKDAVRQLALQGQIVAKPIGQYKQLFDAGIFAHVAFKIGIVTAPLPGGLAEQCHVQDIRLSGIGNCDLFRGNDSRNEAGLDSVGVDAIVELRQGAIEVPRQGKPAIFVIL